MLQPDPLETQLNSLDKAEREDALASLIARAASRRVQLSELSETVNLHMHSHHSFNGYGFSVQRNIWEARKLGIKHFGIVEFDTVAHLPEVQETAKQFPIQVISGIESRCYVPALSGVEINSPGEPGIAYAMGHALRHPPKPGSDGERILAELFQKAQYRIKYQIEKMNPVLGDEVALDYDEHLVTMTPSENVMERHVVAAYIDSAQQAYREPNALSAYWASKLGKSESEVDMLLLDTPKLADEIRSKFMKSGGVAYIQGTQEDFPSITDFFQAVEECGGVPMIAWLDGTLPGEEDPTKLIETMCGYGAKAANIIPLRNYTGKTGDEAARKYQKMKAFIAAAVDHNLPLSFGTEGNKFGLPLVDNWTCKQLAPYNELAIEGAEKLHRHATGKKTL